MTELGFKKSVDEYFSGVNQGVQHAAVETMLSSVVDELDGHPNRKFSFAEVKYLQMWYTR
jgi:lysosomal alpha-mannosidase